jgi:hypothetical protein
VPFIIGFSIIHGTPFVLVRRFSDYLSCPSPSHLPSSAPQRCGRGDQLPVSTKRMVAGIAIVHLWWLWLLISASMLQSSSVFHHDSISSGKSSSGMLPPPIGPSPLNPSSSQSLFLSSIRSSIYRRLTGDIVRVLQLPSSNVHVHIPLTKTTEFQVTKKRSTQQRGKAPPMPNIFMLIIESGGIYGGKSMYNDYPTSIPNKDKPSVTPFLHKLALSENTIVMDTMYPSIPNTNKALIEILCGITPLLSTSWYDITSPLMKKCLPNLLNDQAYYTAFVTPSPLARKHGVQSASGFQYLIGRDEIEEWHQQVLLRRFPRSHVIPFTFCLSSCLNANLVVCSVGYPPMLKIVHYKH